MSGNDGSRTVTVRDVFQGLSLARVRKNGGLEGAGACKTNSLRAMEHGHDLSVIRPWRRATIAVSAFAAVELLVLAASDRPLRQPARDHLREPPPRGTPPVAPPARAGEEADLARSETSVMVLNGRRRSGAADAAADRVTPTATCSGNRQRARDTPRTLIMFRPGYAAEGCGSGTTCACGSCGRSTA